MLDNSSWIIGRLVKDFETWMTDNTRHQVKQNIEGKWADLKERGKRAGVERGGGQTY